MTRKANPLIQFQLPCARGIMAATQAWIAYIWTKKLTYWTDHELSQPQALCFVMTSFIPTAWYTYFLSWLNNPASMWDAFKREYRSFSLVTWTEMQLRTLDHVLVWILYICARMSQLQRSQWILLISGFSLPFKGPLNSLQTRNFVVKFNKQFFLPSVWGQLMLPFVSYDM